MLGLAVRNTAKLIRMKSKSENVRLGRFFTKKETARLMAHMLSLDSEKTAYTVLDPGAGTGILSAAVVEEICKRCKNCKVIFLTCYENNPYFIPMLEDNLERVRKKARHDYDVKLYVTVYEENYITESKGHYTVTMTDIVEDKFDIIICNPPTDLVEKGSSEASRAGGVTQVKINAAYLFAKMAAKHLEDGGRLVIMLPTSVASAQSLASYRKEMAELISLEKIHLFVGKQKNSKRAVPLKKSIILSYRKAPKPNSILITTSTDWGKPENITVLEPQPYAFVVDKTDGTLTLPKSHEDANIVKYFSAFPETLDSLGLKVSTGLVLDSRCAGLLFSEPMRGCIPLIRPVSIQGGKVHFPMPIKHQYLAATNPSIIQKNKNMVFIKRVPAKSDERLLSSAIHMAGAMPQYSYISTHNKINYIDTKDKSGEMCARLVWGLFALLNSTIYDRYMSIVSKSGQVNAKELRYLPMPPRNIIENIGMRLLQARETTVSACDQIVNPTLHIKTRN